MKLLILLALAVVGQCALLGSRKCTYGPSYWCSHIHHAKECGAVQHCLTTTWKNQRLQAALTGSTETCFDAIRVLDVVRQSPDAELVNKMAYGCTGLSGEKRQVCKELVTHDKEEVFQVLNSDLTSMQMAAVFGLCGGFPDHVNHPVVKSSPVSGDYCTDCVNFFGDLRQIFNNTEGQAVAQLKSLVCVKLGPLQSMCNQFVDQYAALAFNFLYQQMDPDNVCYLLKLCSTMDNHHLLLALQRAVSRTEVGDTECDLCQSAAKDVQAALRDPTVQTDVTNALKTDVCPLLGSFSSQCQSYVTTYAPVVFQILVSELDPVTVCQSLKLCNASKVEVKLVRLPLTSDNSAVHVRTQQTAPAKSSPQACALCEMVVKELDQVISTNSTEEEIKTELYKICDLLPMAKLAGECKSMITVFGSQIIKYLIDNEFDATTICTDLKFCSASQQARADGLVHIIAEKQALSKPSPQGCALCKMLVEELDQYVSKNATAAELKAQMEALCTKLPSSLTSICTNLVSKYGDEIIQYLIKNEFNPTTVCTDIQFCAAAYVPKPERVRSAVLCKDCQKVMTLVKQELNDTTSIEYVLNKVCSLIPQPLASACELLVTKYGPSIINLIQQGIDVDEICDKLDLCPAQQAERQEPVLRFQPMSVLTAAKPHLLGQSECTWGPAYWCRSMDNARKCQAVEHCVSRGLLSRGD